jgi:hypothetical protein
MRMIADLRILWKMMSISDGAALPAGFSTWARREAADGCPQGMSVPEFSDNLLQLLAAAVPTFPAAELLVFLAGHTERIWSAEDIVNAIKPISISIVTVQEYMALFKANGIVDEKTKGEFMFTPASSSLQAAVEELTHAYNERPVTLIRIIYTVSEDSIQSFADSFRLKKE